MSYLTMKTFTKANDKTANAHSTAEYYVTSVTSE